MSEKQPKSKSEHTLTGRVLATGLATLALGVGVATEAESKAQQAGHKTEMAKSPIWSPEQKRNALIKQRANEQRSFAGFGKLKKSLPGTIDAVLKKNYLTTLGFLPGETAKYILSVGDSHHGTSTLRMDYVKGGLQTITVTENQKDPNDFEPLENLEYTQISKAKNGYKITRQSMPAPPAPGPTIGNSIFREPVFSYATMHSFDLSERRAITSSFNSAQREVQVVLNDIAQFGLYKPPAA